jgi:NADH dehydrogenase
MAETNKVVIIGGGFAGMYAALSLRKTPVDITLIDRRNFHLFQPLLYQVATGALSPADIAVPLRGVLKRQKRTRVELAEAVDIDVDNRKVIFSDGEIDYDTLIVAAGVGNHYFGKDHWEQMAPGLKTIEEATDIRRRILLAFEAAERAENDETTRRWLNFVVVGGGATGVELAGALGEISRDTLRQDFRKINPADAKILLIESNERILMAYPPSLSAKARRTLEKLGVTVRTKSIVSDIQPDFVVIRSDNIDEKIPTHTVLWAAGIKASPLGKILSDKAGATIDRAGRVEVLPDLTVPGHPEIIVIGDLSSFSHQNGKPLPGLAPVAMQQGHYAAMLIKARLQGKSLMPFRYRDYGSMATIGKKNAVADIGPLHIAGFLGWVAWLFIHLMYIVEFENRILVIVQWAWNYFTGNRAARLITGESPFPLEKKKSEL